MEVARLPYIAKAAIALTACFAVYLVYFQLTVGRKRWILAHEKGCLPSPEYPQWDKVLGYSMFKETFRSLQNHAFLELSYDRFRMMGVNTYKFVALRQRMLYV